jgi:hypothetical protein
MMKKIGAIIAAVGLFALVGLPLVASAQGSAECCRLSQDITMNDFTYGKGADCTYHPGPTTFTRNDVMGAGDCLGATVDKCTLKGIEVNLDVESQEWGTVCLLNSVYNVTNWIFYFFLAVAILIGVIAGFQFMTAAGDPAKVASARSLLMYMVIGLVVAALAKVIPTLVRTIVGF